MYRLSIFYSIFILRTLSVLSTIEEPEFLSKQLALARFDYAHETRADTVGYDNHDDLFYKLERSDTNSHTDLADLEYKRENFQELKLTSVERDQTGHGKNASVHPFIVAQQSLVKNGTMSLRWDVKVNTFGHQFLGHYYGTQTTLTNRMRAHLTRWIVNGIKDYLPILDATFGPLKGNLEIIETELKLVIKRIILRLSERVIERVEDLEHYRDLNYKEDNFAGGSVVSISDEYLITTIMGQSIVLLYDESGHLIEKISESQISFMYSLFIESKNPCKRPLVKIIPRTYQGKRIAFILLATPSVARLFSIDELNEIVKSQNLNDQNRVEMKEKLVRQIMELASSRAKNILDEKDVQNSDLSVIFVELKETQKNDCS